LKSIRRSPLNADISVGPSIFPNLTLELDVVVTSKVTGLLTPDGSVIVTDAEFPGSSVRELNSEYD